MRGSRGWTGGLDPPPLKNHKNIGFLRNTGPDPLKITKLLSQHSMLARQRNAIDDPILVVFGSSLSLIKKQTNVLRVGPTLTKLSGSTHGTQQG